MNTLSCKKCGAHSQSDQHMKYCPICETPNPDYIEPAPPIDPNAGGQGQSTTSQSASSPGGQVAAPIAPPAQIPAPAIAAAAVVSAPAPAPTVPLARQIESNAAIALDDVEEVAAIITKSFAGTPVATIFALLGPAAGIGAAVLHQHLQHVGFDLSALKPIEPIA